MKRCLILLLVTPYLAAEKNVQSVIRSCLSRKTSEPRDIPAIVTQCLGTKSIPERTFTGMYLLIKPQILQTYRDIIPDIEQRLKTAFDKLGLRINQKVTCNIRQDSSVICTNPHQN